MEIGWEERLRNDLFCVEWDINLNSVARNGTECAKYFLPRCMHASNLQCST